MSTLGQHSGFCNRYNIDSYLKEFPKKVHETQSVDSI